MTDAHTNNLGVVTVSGSTYYIKDIEARAALTLAESRIGTNEQDIATLKAAVKDGAHFIGLIDASQDPKIVDGATTSPVKITGAESEVKTVTPSAGDFCFQHATINGASVTQEFAWDGSAWREFGSTGVLKGMAFVDKGTVTVEPKGSVNVGDTSAVTDTVTDPTFTGTAKAPTASFTGTQGSVSVAGTPTGSVSKPDVTVTPQTGTIQEVAITPPTEATPETPSNETLVIAFTTKTFMTGAAAQLAAAPVFTGDELESTGNFTPAGSVNCDPYTPEGTNTGTAVTLKPHNHSGSFTGTQETLDVNPKTV